MIADALTTAALGTCVTGGGIAVVQGALGYLNSRADRKTRSPVRRRWLTRFLDWLTRFVLGPKRLDHEPLYSCTVSAVFLVGFFWTVTGPLPQSIIFTFPDQTQITLAACMFVGSGTCLYGVTMGTPFDVWRRAVRIKHLLRGQPGRPPLDLRRAYRVGASGVPAVIVALSYYTAILVRDTPFAWTGPSAIFLGFICLGMLFQWLRFLMETRRINQTIPVLIEQEIERRKIARETSRRSIDQTLNDPDWRRRRLK